MNARYGVTIGFLLLAVPSCARPETRTATTVTTGARMILNDDAAMILTNARCQHESVCGNVGSARRFASHDACRSEVFPDASDRVRPEVCPAGVDEAKLSRCLSDVRSQRCADGSVTTGVLASCRERELCVAR
jgi:hypothetical protein